MSTLWEEIVDALEEVNGVHPGFRRVHAKGTVCAGSFTATPEAAGLSVAGHLQGEPVGATVRFSNASGKPHAADANPIAGRGMAVKFQLPGGGETDIVSVALTVFMVRTPEDFLAFTRARTPDPRTGELDMEKVGAFLAEHPETATALQLSQPALAPTTSYATSAFNALHAFALVGSAGERTWGRYGWVPEAGAETLTEEQATEADRDYLQHEIRERLAGGTAAFSLEFTLASAGDSLDDPTRAWEGEHEVVRLGRLELDSVIEDPEADGVMAWDPMRLTEGVEPSDDKILAARSPAYSVSIERRAAGA